MKEIYLKPPTIESKLWGGRISGREGISNPLTSRGKEECYSPFEERDEERETKGDVGSVRLEGSLVGKGVSRDAVRLEGSHEAHVRDEDGHPTKERKPDELSDSRSDEEKLKKRNRGSPSDGTQHRNDRDKVLEDGQSLARTDTVGETAEDWMKSVRVRVSKSIWRWKEKGKERNAPVQTARA
jgi:hypothetical protein